MGEAVTFYVLSALILVSAVFVVTSRNTVYSVLALVASFLCVAMLYVLLHAEFIAVIQVLVYAGGIVVLYLFVVMLVNLRRPEVHQDPRRYARVGIALAGAVLVEFVAIGLYAFARPLPAAEGVEATGGGIEAIGQMLYVDYLIPFELASILLLVAMVGAIVLAKREL